ncbi:tyrosine-type recombinase/integrase [Streptomyces chrestomyceticus]|uniref:tyrosine-type recombinase/integrase n=1 Tax=Streptomyces chrestomyceticus TaxID=68185 RepID=UPI0033F4100D
MAGYVEDRWIKKKKDSVTGKRERTSRYGKGSRYRVSGIPGVRDRSFETLEDAKAWLRRSSTDQERGEFVDPRDGSILLEDYVQRFWFPGMSGSIKTRQNQSRKVLLHVLPHLGQVPLRDVTAARLRAYIADLEKSCSPQYARAILGALSSIFETAIDDKRLIRNPMRAKSVRWPKADEVRREAWPLETARQMRDSISDRYRITVVLGVGCGLRQGEVFGLSPDDIDYEKGVIYVRRQVQTFCGRLYFTLPKGGKTRVADMPVSVACELREHSEKYPAVEVELPWGEPGKPTRTVLLLLTTRFGNAVAVNTYNTYIWKPALARVGIIPPRPAGAKPWQWKAAHRDGFHVLRHTYASLVLEAGESVVTLARWLGHSSSVITLSHYAHFMPEAGGRGRRAIDGLLGDPVDTVVEN